MLSSLPSPQVTPPGPWSGLHPDRSLHLRGSLWESSDDSVLVGSVVLTERTRDVRRVDPERKTAVPLPGNFPDLVFPTSPTSVLGRPGLGQERPRGVRNRVGGPHRTEEESPRLPVSRGEGWMVEQGLYLLLYPRRGVSVSWKFWYTVVV